MLLKGALHTHSTCSDGALTIRQLIDTYVALGFDFLAVTDHDFLLRPGCREQQLADIKTDLMVFLGVERTVFEKGYVHVNEIPGDTETLHVFNHPAQLDLPFEKAVERIHCVAKKVPLDAIEITSQGFYTPEYDVQSIPYAKVATDDAHTRIACGRAWIEMDCSRSKDAIIRAVKQGEFWNCFQNN